MTVFIHCELSLGVADSVNIWSAESPEASGSATRRVRRHKIKGGTSADFPG